MKIGYFLACLAMLTFENSFASEINDEVCDYAGTDRQMNTCAARDYVIADKELNRTYQEVMSTLSKPKRVELKKSQRAWLKQRDKNCIEDQEVGDMAHGGSWWPMLYNNCLRAATNSRIEELRNWK